MNTQTLQNNWSDIKAQIKTKWSKFSETELDSFKDNLDKLSGQIQKTYGVAKEQAEKEFNDFKKSIQAAAAVPPVAAAGKPAAKSGFTVASQRNAMDSEGGSPVKKSQAV